MNFFRNHITNRVLNNLIRCISTSKLPIYRFPYRARDFGSGGSNKSDDGSGRNLSSGGDGQTLGVSGGVGGSRDGFNGGLDWAVVSSPHPLYLNEGASDAEESKSIEGTTVADDYGQDESLKGNYKDDDDVLDSLSRHRFRSPPAEIMAIVDAPRPSVSFMSPTEDKIVRLKKSTLPPLHELARQREERLAGLQIDTECNCPSRESYYSIEGIKERKKPMKKISGIPCGAKIHYIIWSYDGRHLSFSVQTDKKNGSRSMLSIWIADVVTLNARPLLPSEMFINTTLTLFLWVNKSTLLVPTIPMSRGACPKKPKVPFGPIIFSSEENKIIQARTYPGLLTDEHDVAGFEYYTTSQLVLVSLDGSRKFFGSQAIYTSFALSPDENFILISSIHPPYSTAVKFDLFPKKVEVWTTAGEFVTQVCDLPLAEDIPCARHCVRKGMRHIQWVPCIFPTLLWVTAQDGGDARVEANPRDIVYTQRLYSFGREEPKVFCELPFRFGCIDWSRFQQCLRACICVVVEGKKKRFRIVNYEHDDAFKNDVYSAISSLELGKTYGVVDKESARIDGFPYAKKIDIQYKRKDGKELDADLYLPPSYNRDRDGPLPCLVYPYPRIEDAIPETIFISPTSPHIWLSRGFVVLTNLSMPIMDDKHKGEGYDRFVEQLVTSVEAAVKEVIRLGVADPSKIAIGGHSFGALMTSILLLHAPHLFCCGIARSGAYNRTLTPFGYQRERRTIWEATSSYLEMSTILEAHKIKKPILLIHGGEDENAGTPTMQSKRFFEALRGNGANCRLVILPFEGHTYLARENILHVLWETDRWLQKHCLANSSVD